MTGPELIDAGFKMFGIGLGFWACKAYISKVSKTPDAATGFLNLNALQKHCERVQSSCIDKLDGKIQALADSVSTRLQTDNQILDDHEMRLRNIQVDLTKSIENLKVIQSNHAKQVATEIVNQLRRKKS